ncbi:MAG TPA: response regulator, partial [Desulforhopalus sp.]|nr:response regulator [Desulforhopalus sp.]
MITDKGRGDYGATILVVDDKPANIKLLFDALQGTGYRTLAALDGESAVRQAELAAPDLILMDVMMPGIDGFEACRQLKALPATRHIPVIFMTALAETSAKVKGFKAGGVDYLTKPLQHDEVLARIDAHM